MCMITRSRTPYHPIQDLSSVAMDSNFGAIRNIRLEAPTFDGYEDPKTYLNWERDMDQYFEGDLMTEKRKFQFAKLKLVRQARLYWGDVERLDRHRGELPIATWRDMKIRLREKYVPIAYHKRLFDKWKRLS